MADGRVQDTACGPGIWAVQHAASGSRSSPACMGSVGRGEDILRLTAINGVPRGQIGCGLGTLELQANWGANSCYLIDSNRFQDTQTHRGTESEWCRAHG